VVSCVSEQSVAAPLDWLPPRDADRRLVCCW
jgi:hypothetical protein